MSPCIDIHCHILPGVDDGSPDTETSLRMLRIAADEGVVAMILTPHHKPMHHNVRAEHLGPYRDRLREAAKAQGLQVRLFTGNELYYHAEAVEELLSGRVSTLAGSDCVLVEFHPTDQYRTIRDALSRIYAAGFRPVLAHVERYQDMCAHPSYTEELVDMGVLIQVNAASIMGSYGGGVKRYTRRLLEDGLVHFVA
ncbi:MAG: protein-tyrosine-phosphatase, partial [Butyrivibrio sp.]|nr:protein-tyrosine-phosphatase [Butyrivibrio sp.]